VGVSDPAIPAFEDQTIDAMVLNLSTARAPRSFRDLEPGLVSSRSISALSAS